MNRRSYLKSVAGTPLIPTISVPDVSESVDFEYLDSLFADEYNTTKNPDSPIGIVYSAQWSSTKNKRYSVQYRAFSENDVYDSIVDVYDFTDGFESYGYIPQNHYEAWTLCEIGRKQGLDAILSALDRLDLYQSGEQ